MRYWQLFESRESERLISQILDLLTPIASSGVDYVTVDQVINKAQSLASGLHVDRELIMSVLSPDRFPMIKSIEGDKLYLKGIDNPIRSVSKDQKDQEAEKIKDVAAKQAAKQVKN